MRWANNLKFILILILITGFLYAECAAGETPNAAGGCDPVDNNNNNNFTPGAGGEIYDALQKLCSLVKNSLAVGMMFMVVSASLVYAVGQVMGAETRARASVWATSMFNGAIIAALIYLLVPFVLDILVGAQLGGNVSGLC